VPETLVLKTRDGVELEAELAHADHALRAAMVLCHPHPQYGGTMRSIVIGALFDALPAHGVTTLRFNFRGVERSTGTHDAGRGEAGDARAAVRALTAMLPAGTPLILAGWSFGADMALSVLDPVVTAWVAIAPPLHLVHDADAVGADPRPKLLALAEHDEVRPPEEIATAVTGWATTELVTVPGASHFFVGRTDRLTSVVAAFVDRVVAPTA
jgi:alpha/beta superfamily hydrolase